MRTQKYLSRARILFIQESNEIFHLRHISGIWNWKSRGCCAISNCDLLNWGKLSGRQIVCIMICCNLHTSTRHLQAFSLKGNDNTAESACSQIISNGNMMKSVGQIRTCCSLIGFWGPGAWAQKHLSTEEESAHGSHIWVNTPHAVTFLSSLIAFSCYLSFLFVI